MLDAARPTARMVTDEKSIGSIAPTNIPISVCILSRLRLNSKSRICSAIVSRNAEISVTAVSAAEPIAKPFPVAAVVFPRLSSASVRSRTISSCPDITAIPPALSATGPYASVASVIPRVESIPTEASPTPYSPG